MIYKQQVHQTRSISYGATAAAAWSVQGYAQQVAGDDQHQR